MVARDFDVCAACVQCCAEAQSQGVSADLIAVAPILAPMKGWQRSGDCTVTTGRVWGPQLMPMGVAAPSHQGDTTSFPKVWSPYREPKKSFAVPVPKKGAAELTLGIV